ncbi:hypothetical protein BC830DRAFT_1138821 [Chytriomyces sp. MP71]|nr:hypothetical protein BC830DRAFT_1138821 [Chytriomyces sp. MP71]
MKAPILLFASFLVATAHSLRILIAMDAGTRSHVVPIFNIAKLLHERNHTIIYAAPAQLEGFKMNHDFIQFAPLHLNFSDPASGIAARVDLPNTLKTQASLIQVLFDKFSAMYPGAVKAYDAVFNETAADLILCDFFATACLDTAHARGLNYGIIGPVGWQGFQSQWYIPGPLNPVPQSEWTTSPVSRLLKPIELMWGIGYTFLKSVHKLGKVQAEVWGGVAPPSFAQHASKHLYLSHSFFPFFAAQPLPPNVLTLGPLVDPTMQPLDAEMQAFLNQPHIHRVIYIAFGSGLKALGTLKSRLLAGLGPLLHQHPNLAVAWGCADPLCPATRDAQLPAHLRDRVLLRPWMDQVGMLAHPKVRVFISHGGVSSLFESLHFGVPLLVVPVFGDQLLNAVRVEETGVGLALHEKNTFREEDVTERLGVLLRATAEGGEPVGKLSFESVRRMQKIARLARETSLMQGANAIEMVASVGVDGWIPAVETLSASEMMGLGKVDLRKVGTAVMLGALAVYFIATRK